MNRKKPVSVCAVFAALCMHVYLALPAFGATVSIDPGQTYRTIDGLGFCSVPLQMYKVRQGPFLVEAEWEPFAETLVTVVGATMFRGFATHSCDFNPSPGEYVIPPNLRTELERLRDLRDIADACGEEPVRYAPVVFSPAPWMKWNNRCAAFESTYPSDTTNSLTPDHYDDFGAMCSAFVRICIDTFGVTPFAFSSQNEPYFNEPFASCSYRNGIHYAQMLRFVGPSVKRASPATLIFGTDHVGWDFPSWEMAVLRDSVAGDYLDRFGVHGATNAVDVVLEIDTTLNRKWSTTYPRDKWMSEFNYKTMNYDTSFKQASIVLNSLGDGGNFTGYLAGGGKPFWDGGGYGGGTGPHSPGFYLNAQFMRFVRPGMTRVKTQTDESLLRAIAFKNDVRGSFSVVILNGSREDLEVTLASTGTIPDSLEMRTTDSTQGFVEGPLQDGRSPVTVPAKGMVSLGYRIRGPQPVDPQPVVERGSRPLIQQRGAAMRGVVRVFDLRGRMLQPDVHSSRSSRLPVSVVVRRDADGRATISVRGQVWR